MPIPAPPRLIHKSRTSHSLWSFSKGGEEPRLMFWSAEPSACPKARRPATGQARYAERPTRRRGHSYQSLCKNTMHCLCKLAYIEVPACVSPATVWQWSSGQKHRRPDAQANAPAAKTCRDKLMKDSFLSYKQPQLCTAPCGASLKSMGHRQRIRGSL